LHPTGLSELGLQFQSVIDLHSHVLAGIDDGPATVEQSIALAREAAAAGTRVLLATPHVSRRYANDPATIARLVGELNSRLAAEGVALQVLAGAEVAITPALEHEPAELQRFSLGGGPWLLVEPPIRAVATGLDMLILELQRRGHRILLAHPERCPAFQRDPEMLHSLVGQGVLTSITAGSLVGRFGGSVRRFALELVREGLVHNVASDAHDLRSRPPGMAAALERTGLGPLADWLTRAVPEAILGGEAIPPQPAVALPALEPARRRRWSRRLMRAS
jgi:protein-tyrosine phosphatase